MPASGAVVCGREPVLRVRYLAARVAEKRETKVQEHDQRERRNEDKQCKWLMPGKYREREEQPEENT